LLELIYATAEICKKHWMLGAVSRRLVCPCRCGQVQKTAGGITEPGKKLSIRCFSLDAFAENPPNICIITYLLHVKKINSINNYA
jgi:hypothetical protein